MDPNKNGRDVRYKPKGYVSCIKVNGRPILPPIMTEELKAEMAYYRELAIQRENSRRQEKVQLTRDESISESDKEEFQSANNDLDPPSTPITPVNFEFDDIGSNNALLKSPLKDEESTTPSSETCSNDDVKSVIETPRPNVGFRKFFESPVKTFDAIMNKSASSTEKSEIEKVDFNLSESESDSDKENREEFHSIPTTKLPNLHGILTPPEMSPIKSPQKENDECDGGKTSKSSVSFNLMPPPPVPPVEASIPTSTTSNVITNPADSSEEKSSDEFFTRRARRKTRYFSPEPNEKTSDTNEKSSMNSNSPKKNVESKVESSEITPEENKSPKQSGETRLPLQSITSEGVDESIYATPFQFTTPGHSPRDESFNSSTIDGDEESDADKTPVKKGKHVRRLSYTLISPSAALLAASALDVIPPAYQSQGVQALSPIKKDEDLQPHVFLSHSEDPPSDNLEDENEEENAEEREKTLAAQGEELENDLDVRIEYLNQQMMKLQAGIKRNSQGVHVNKTYDVECNEESEKDGTPGWLNKMVEEPHKKSPLSREKLSQSSSSSIAEFQNRRGVVKHSPQNSEVLKSKDESLVNKTVKTVLQAQIQTLKQEQQKQLEKLMEFQREQQEKLLEDFERQRVLLAIEIEKIAIDDDKENCEKEDEEYQEDFEDETGSEKENSSISIALLSGESLKSTSEQFDQITSLRDSSETEIPNSTENSTLQGSLSVLSTDRESISNGGLFKLHEKMQNSSANRNSFKPPSDAKSPLLKGLTLPSRLDRPSTALIRTYPNIDDRMNKKFCKVSAAVKGYLVRRILSTEKVQMVIQTIKETVKLILQLCEDDVNPESNSFSVKKQDVELRKRLEQQLRGTCNSFFDVFFKLTTPQRMAIIANDREKMFIKSRNPSPVKKSVSSATMKSIERRSGLSPKRSSRMSSARAMRMSNSDKAGEKNLTFKRRRMSFFDHHRTSTAPPQARKPLFRSSTAPADQNGNTNKWTVSEFTTLQYRPSNSSGMDFSARSANSTYSTSGSNPNSARNFNAEQPSNTYTKRLSINKTRWK